MVNCCYIIAMQQIVGCLPADLSIDLSSKSNMTSYALRENNNPKKRRLYDSFG